MGGQGSMESIQAARRCGAPIVAVETPDPYAVVRAVAGRINGGTAILLWDCVLGLRGANEAGQREAARVRGLLDGVRAEGLKDSEGLRASLAGSFEGIKRDAGALIVSSSRRFSFAADDDQAAA